MGYERIQLPRSDLLRQVISSLVQLIHHPRDVLITLLLDALEHLSLCILVLLLRPAADEREGMCNYGVSVRVVKPHKDLVI